jgi:hypothetical protein
METQQPSRRAILVYDILAFLIVATTLGSIVAFACCCAADGGCPTKLAQRSAEWRALPGEDPECAELAIALTAADPSDDEGCAAETLIEQRDGACMARVSSECDGFAVTLDCALRSSGAADCEASVIGDTLSCRLRVQLR